MPTEQDRENNLQHAREVAYQCMLEYGINLTTYEMIAQKSGLGIRTLRRYFRNKIELICDVMRTVGSKRYHALYANIKASISADDTGLEQLRQLHYRMFDLCNQRHFPWLMRSELELFMYENRVSSELLSLYLGEVHEFRQYAKQMIIQGMADGSIRKDIDPDAYTTLTANTYVGMLQRMEAVRYVKNDYNLASFQKQVDLYVNAVMAFMKKSSEESIAVDKIKTPAQSDTKKHWEKN